MSFFLISLLILQHIIATPSSDLASLEISLSHLAQKIPAQPKQPEKIMPVEITISSLYKKIITTLDGDTKTIKQPPLIPLEDFYNTMISAAEATRKFHESYPWLSDIKPETKIYSLEDGTLSLYYTQKLTLEENAIVAIWGDTHGSGASLIRELNYLKNTNILDDNFTLIKPDHYFLFLGDCTDRGLYGVEIWYMLFRLKAANPAKVFVVRGNHEDQMLNKDYGFFEEFIEKYAPHYLTDKKKMCIEEFHKNPELIKNNNFVHYCKKIFGNQNFINDYSLMLEKHHQTNKSNEDKIKIYNCLMNYYNLLPVAIFLGSNNQYVQCCHGGIEIGYTPLNLFEEKSLICFEKITELKREHYHKQLSNDWENLSKLNEFNFNPKDPLEFDRFRRNYLFDITIKDLPEVGFCWNDFNAKDNSILKWTEGRGWMFGKILTKNILSFYSNKAITMNSIFRAHQHNTSMDPELTVTKGCFNLWDGTVFTFFSAPDIRISNFFTEYKFDTFRILTTGRTFDEWKISKVWSRILPADQWKNFSETFIKEPAEPIRQAGIYSQELHQKFKEEYQS